MKKRSLAILSIALPIMLQNMAFYLQTFINTAFIGHYDIRGLSAIHTTMVPFFMLFSFFIALSQGTTIHIAQALGANDVPLAGRVAESSLFYNQLISFGYFIFWYFAGAAVLGAMGARGDILEMGSGYVRVLSLMYLTLGLNITSASIYQGAGTTYPVMITMFLRVGLNVLLDYLLIFGKFGFPRLGVTGAAVATVISTTISNVTLLVMLLRSGILPLSLSGILHPAPGVYAKVFLFGLQAGSEFLLFSAAQVFMVRMLNGFDQLGAGMYGILNTLLNLSVNLYLGIGIAAMSLVGKATGATDHHEAFRTGNECMVWSIALCLTVGTVFVSRPLQIMHIFTSDIETVSRLLPLLPIVVLLSFPKAVNIVIGNSIRGTGDPRWMLYTQSAGTVLVVLFSSYLLLGRHLGVAALVWANFGDEAWRAAVNYGRFFIRGRKRMRETRIPARVPLSN